MNLRKNTPADAVVVEEPSEGSNKKVLVAGGVAAGLAVVAAMSYVLLAGGSDDTETGVVAAAKHTVTQKPTAAPSPAKSAPAIQKFTGKNARDPFKALVVEPAAASGGSTASTSGSSSGSTGSSSGTGSTSGSTSGSTTSGGTVANPVGGSTSGSTPKSTDPVTITLVSVTSTDTAATFTLDKQSYKNVKPQATFGTYFKLLNLTEGKCGAVQYGDVTFDMCEGDSLTLR